MPYFRFPGGCHDRRALKALTPAGVTAVQWDVVGGDAFATDPDAVARQVLDGVRPGSVVVLHCTRSAAPTTEEAVRKVVPELRRQGYRFVKVSELIGAANGRG
jgi:peptidoglycan/xylan/chitin deacetylase (PgdA/CDA1 family)